VISSPQTNSIKPAHQIGNAPTSTGIGAATGQSNSFCAPCRVNSRPKMMRKALKAGDEIPASLDSKLVAMG
jgi:hypothetical protein